MLAGSRPAAAHDGPDGKITHKRKEVRTQPDPEQEWRDAEVGDLVYKLGRVNTLADSTAAVVFRDDSSVAMRADTLLIIYGHHALRNKKLVATGAGLERGALRARLGELEAMTDDNGRAAVATPGATTELEGGNSLLKVDDAGTSRIHNHGNGNATVAAKAGGKTKVNKGMGVKVEKTKRAAKPIPLPPTPSWVAGPEQFLGVSGRISALRGGWGTIDKANSYYVEVAADPEGLDVLSAIEVPKSVENFEVHGLPPGSYHVRVAAVDNDQFESIPSDVRSVELLDVELVGPGDVGPIWPEGADAGLAPVPVVLPGTALSLPAGIRCGATAELLEARPLFIEQGVHELVCQNDAGDAVVSFPVRVPDLAPGLRDGEASGPDQAKAVEVVRGQRTTHELVLDTALALPEQLYLSAPEGVTVESVTPGTQPGTWSIVLLAGPTAAPEAELGLSFLAPGTSQANTQFSTVSITIVEPPEGPTEPAKPERHMFEFGVAGGLVLLSQTHGLYHSIDTAHQPFHRPAGEFVLRAGYYPIRWVGVELDGRVIPTRVANDARATAYSVRAQVLGQLPYRVTPFIVIGGEMLGVSSGPAAVGKDTDFGAHAGGGVKFYATKRVALRLGVTGMFHEGLGTKGAVHLEADLGLSVVLGRRSAGRKR
ncbi:putative internalin [Enhygromyxa salina]|uniref:Putative internalin n=2 Tax=Enhygromyxa salina TaxID=215803 RepID=A0A0C1ZJD3_9BACT|nr:putative internalin [Enhygromyxa salina]